MKKKINTHTKHPWHEVSFGKKIPEEFIVFIEVPKGGVLKYELDKDSGHIMLDRVLYSSVYYPGDYGFIPQTLANDDDPLDVLIISNFPVHPGTLVKAKPIGVMEMLDNHKKDEKIIAVHSKDPRLKKIKDIKNLDQHVILEIKHFFETYKELQEKKSTIIKVLGKQQAKEKILKAIKKYKEEFE